ncbi:hypothetical protein PoB_005196300 [Plakobranchus ocellatus]|uniref:Uncharacterized protein n=1 Tax=Plakobranchus ocellatus TaxID=259542 RepID=A0AAV4C212_9GAST|nr:hypothetical protein PoB_005196300 [Plakobranchus ocellatus]
MNYSCSESELSRRMDTILAVHKGNDTTQWKSGKILLEKMGISPNTLTKTSELLEKMGINPNTLTITSELLEKMGISSNTLTITSELLEKMGISLNTLTI